jgi:YfiR/HmsC-like
LKKVLIVFLVLVVIVGILFPMSGSGSLQTQYTLLLKILTYNKNFLNKATDKVIIGIVFQSSYRPSIDTKETLIDVIDESGLKVENRIVNYILMDLSGSGGFEYFVKNNSPDVLFVLPMRGVNIGSITSVSEKYKIMTFTIVPAYMNDGISTCVNMDGEKPVIIINRNSARNEGVDFSSQLLKVARIIE